MNGGGMNDYANLETKEAFKRQLQAMRSWCCSYWAYLHIFMIILIVITEQTFMIAVLSIVNKFEIE